MSSGRIVENESKREEELPSPSNDFLFKISEKESAGRGTLKSIRTVQLIHLIQIFWQFSLKLIKNLHFVFQQCHLYKPI